MSKAATLLRAQRPDDVYRLFTTSFWDGSPLAEPPSLNRRSLPDGASSVTRMMLHDTTSYLPDDILTKVDRAAMAVSLETRVPLLTPELFQFAHRLPPAYRMHRGESKVVMRTLLRRHVPAALWDQPKRGFSVPLGSWLRGPLKDWADDLLAPTALQAHGLLDGLRVRRLWADHVAGRRDWGSQLWNLLMFQAWHDRWIASPAT
jgi:asparagine synthase (glutamine-hydrolysing)